MMLTDREWLRMVTFALVVGIVLGSLYTGALTLRGHGPMWSMAGSIMGSGALAMLVHAGLRYLLDRATDPTTDTPDTETQA